MDIAEFKNSIEKHRALIGFDYGSKRLGVAVSDILCTIATPYKIIYRTTWQKDITEIRKIIEQKEIGGFVYGLPLQMNGIEGEIAAQVREFAAKLATEINLPYMFWDERLSSSAVERFLVDTVDMSRAKRKKVLDSSAAAYILQGALDALKLL